VSDGEKCLCDYCRNDNCIAVLAVEAHQIANARADKAETDLKDAQDKIVQLSIDREEETDLLKARVAELVGALLKIYKINPDGYKAREIACEALAKAEDGGSSDKGGVRNGKVA